MTRCFSELPGGASGTGFIHLINAVPHTTVLDLEGWLSLLMPAGAGLEQRALPEAPCHAELLWDTSRNCGHHSLEFYPTCLSLAPKAGVGKEPLVSAL